MKRMSVLSVTILTALLLLAAQCGPAPTPETITVVETVVVEKVVEKEVEGETVQVVETVVVEKEVEKVVTATPEPVDTGPTPVPADATPQEGGILRIANAFNLRGCDMHLRGSSTTHQHACGAIVADTLLTLEDKKVFAPMLAESWEISDDSRTYTFNLRQGVTFHDGTPFNAEAVKVNFERIMDPELNAVFYPVFKNIESIETPDESTIVVTLTTADINFPISLVQYGTAIYSPEALANGDVDTNPIGTGPFKIVSFAPDHLVFERNDEYWNGKPYLEGVDVKVVPDPISRVFELEAGTSDVILWVPETEITRIIEQGFNMQSEPGQNHTGVTLNRSKPPLDDIRVREAVLYAIDPAALMEPVWVGRAAVAETGIPAASWAFNESIEAYPYDPEKAKALLEEAGWVVGSQGGIREKDGELLELYFPVGADLPRPQVALIIQDQLRKVGIAADVSVIETFSFYEQVYNCEHDITYWSDSFITLDPAEFYSDFHSSEARDAWCYEDAEMDQLLEEGQALTDPAERKEIYDQVQAKIYDETFVRWIAHYESPSAALQPYVQGWRYPIYRIFKLDKVWLAK